MLVLKTFMLYAVMYITCSEQARSDSVDQGTLNASVADYPVILPVQVLKKLVDISDKSKGLHKLWRNALYLTKDSLMEDEVRVTSVHAYLHMLIVM